MTYATYKLATPNLSGQDAVQSILEVASWADESEIPGLEAALRSILHSDEVDAAMLIDEARGNA